MVVAFLGLLYGGGALYDRYGGTAGVARELVEAAEQGDLEAQNKLGLIYVQGKGVVRDYEKAVKWFRRAAESDYAPAQMNLGQMYLLGTGVAQSDALAVDWNRRAAEQGNAGGQYNLGVAYARGKGVPQDWVQAHAWFSISATNGKKGKGFTRYEVERKMTARQIAKAQEMAREWKRKHPK
ncbi:MAG: tetratricopeptide repeat protein [Rhodospirillales bacterium]|nr:tetratricopeptide repeat protein [Rhodospirillales bacterium]MDP6883505.1 tetratricopeptide repeat protein [Rhodospirillales bacterium]